jgi:HSP20 family protein
MAENTAVARKEAAEVSTPEATWGGVYFTPRVDIFETEDELLFFCDMPGVKPADLDLRFENGELILHGKVQPRQPQTSFLAAEYGVGDFYRAFTVNQKVNVNQLAAEYKQGVLTIHLPKTEEVKPKRINIKAES